MKNFKRENSFEAPIRLSFAYEELYEVPVLEASNSLDIVEILDLSHNNIRDVRSLANFDRLHTIILDRNLLDSGSVFPPLPSLRILWLNNNEIYNISTFIPSLARTCSNIRHLSLMGNPGVPSRCMEELMTEHESYRLFVIGHFPRLEYLDDSVVSDKERENAERLQESVGLVSILPIMRAFREKISSRKSISNVQSFQKSSMAVNGWMGEGLR